MVSSYNLKKTVCAVAAEKSRLNINRYLWTFFVQWECLNNAFYLCYYSCPDHCRWFIAERHVFWLHRQQWRYCHVVSERHIKAACRVLLTLLAGKCWQGCGECWDESLLQSEKDRTIGAQAPNSVAFGRGEDIHCSFQDIITIKAL